MSLATACHPASRNPATTGTQESVCSFCGQLHIFSPPRKKKSCYKSQASSPTPSNHEVDPGQRETLQRAGRAGGEAGPHGWELHSSQFLSIEEKEQLQKRQPRHCQRIVLSLQEEEKPRTNLTWFSPHGDCSSIQGCHSHTTH